jgi:hypothetical protein
VNASEKPKAADWKAPLIMVLHSVIFSVRSVPGCIRGVAFRVDDLIPDTDDEVITGVGYIAWSI